MVEGVCCTFSNFVLANQLQVMPHMVRDCGSIVNHVPASGLFGLNMRGTVIEGQASTEPTGAPSFY